MPSIQAMNLVDGPPAQSASNEVSGDREITLLRVIPTMTFQNSLLTPLLSEAFVTGLLPN